MEMIHHTHEHPLVFTDDENYRYDHDFCFLCAKPVRNPRFECTVINCKYYLHKFCADLPQKIDHHSHDHALFIQLGWRFQCHLCDNKLQHHPRYRCEDCDFDLDVQCALMPAINGQGEKQILHFSHEHSLILCGEDDDANHDCFTCHTRNSDLMYGCISCGYFLHKSCADIPKHVLHALHPCHPLDLSGPAFYGCEYCRKRSYGLKYGCYQCDWFLDVGCAMATISNYEANDHEKPCFACNKVHKDPSHVPFCLPSKYHLNNSCIKLPEEIENPFHLHAQPLVLTVSKGVFCASCHRSLDDGPLFSCWKCNFHMDIKCALISPIDEGQGGEYVTHFTHQHPLRYMIEMVLLLGDDKCYACQTSRSGPTYACMACEYFLHKSCAEVPKEMLHPFHDHDHYLNLQVCCKKYVSCKSCYKSCYGLLVFICIDCAFQICFECATSVFKKIKYEDHPHKLNLIRVNSELTCDDPFCYAKYSEASRDQFNFLGPYWWRCVKCDFNIHTLCGPLPNTIKSKCHIHKLGLQDSVIEDEINEFYCDVCEEERDPRLGVYSCDECPFSAHVSCIPEIPIALRGDVGQMEFRVIGEKKVYKEIEECEAAAIQEQDLETGTIFMYMENYDRRDFKRCFPGLVSLYSLEDKPQLSQLFNLKKDVTAFREIRKSLAEHQDLVQQQDSSDLKMLEQFEDSLDLLEQKRVPNCFSAFLSFCKEHDLPLEETYRFVWHLTPDICARFRNFVESLDDPKEAGSTTSRQQEHKEYSHDDNYRCLDRYPQLRPLSDNDRQVYPFSIHMSVSHKINLSISVSFIY